MIHSYNTKFFIHDTIHTTYCTILTTVILLFLVKKVFLNMKKYNCMYNTRMCFLVITDRTCTVELLIFYLMREKLPHVTVALSSFSS